MIIAFFFLEVQSVKHNHVHDEKYAFSRVTSRWN